MNTIVVTTIAAVSATIIILGRVNLNFSGIIELSGSLTRLNLGLSFCEDVSSYEPISEAMGSPLTLRRSFSENILLHSNQDCLEKTKAFFLLFPYCFLL